MFEPTPDTRDLISRLQEYVDSQRLTDDIANVRYTTSSGASPIIAFPSALMTEELTHRQLVDNRTPEHELLSQGLSGIGFMESGVIKPEQVVGDINEFFICPVCEGVAVDPVITALCSHIICGNCWLIWRGARLDMEPVPCPKCQADNIPSKDISRVSLDSQCQTAAALSLMYEAIIVKCDKCDWIGSAKSYPNHSCCIVGLSSGVTPKSGTVVAIDTFECTDAQETVVLPVRLGDLLEISAESDTGWAFVTKKETHESGWTPSSYLSKTPTRAPSPVGE
jgi:hypothetical protein